MVSSWANFYLESSISHTWIHWNISLHQRKTYQVKSSKSFYHYSEHLYLQALFCCRTVLLHSERLIHFYAFSYTCIPFLLDTFRIYYGPFSGVTCWWYKFFKNFGPLGGQMGFNATLIIRVSTVHVRANSRCRFSSNFVCAHTFTHIFN